MVVTVNVVQRGEVVQRQVARFRMAVRRSMIAFAALGGAALVLPAGVAVGHGSDGYFTVLATRFEPQRALVVLVLELRYSNDDDPVTSAELSVDAAPVFDCTDCPPPRSNYTPIGGGVYEVELSLPRPGAWTVTVSSARPAATRTETVELPPPPTTTTSTVPSSTTTPPPPTFASPSPETPTPERPQTERSPAQAVTVVGVIGIVAIGFGMVIWRQRRR